MRPTLGILALVAGAALCACTRRLVVAEVPSARQPTTTIHYAGVRTGARRFPDYSAIDRRILKAPP